MEVGAAPEKMFKSWKAKENSRTIWNSHFPCSSLCCDAKVKLSTWNGLDLFFQVQVCVRILWKKLFENNYFSENVFLSAFLFLWNQWENKKEIKRFRAKKSVDEMQLQKRKTTSSSNFHGPEKKNTTFYFYPPIKDELSVFPFPLKRNIFNLTRHGANKVLKQ